MAESLVDGMWVLVVDDDPDLRESLRATIEDIGVAVQCVANGRQALDLLATGARPALILLDLMMPVMNGFEFHGIQRRTPAIADLPVVILSARIVDRAAFPIGDVDFVAKPFTLERLREVLTHYGLLVVG